MKKMIATDLLTRVEGHGSLELIREGTLTVDARFHLHESPRLFEKLLLGRRYDEVAEIACRICSICSTAHKVVSLEAIETALNVQVTPLTATMRKLAVLGGVIESHALHLICLALPDYRAVGGFIGLAAHAPAELACGLTIKACGNLLQETVGGRAIHPFNLLPGGLGRLPSIRQFQSLAEHLAALDDPLAALTALCNALPALIPALPAIASAAVDADGHALITSHGETVAAKDVIDWLQQEQVAHSHALQSRFSKGRVYQVGPLARQKLSGTIAGNAPISASPQARVMELRQAVEEALVTIEAVLKEGGSGEEAAPITPREGEGVALIEAPRGTLIHRYRFDELGICTAATVVTPTAINQGAIQESLTALVGNMHGCPETELRSAAEHLVRLFDPCISCAVH